MRAFRRTSTVLGIAAIVGCGSLIAAQSEAAPPPPRPSIDTALATLQRDAAIPGTVWAVGNSGTVVVSYDRSVTGAARARLAAVTATLGDRVRLEPMPGTLRRTMRGGTAIYGSNYRCSLGFNVRSNSTYYFVTAGHCANRASTWYADPSHSKVIGNRAGSSFPGNDYGIVKYAIGVSHPGGINLHNGSTRDITSAPRPYVGEQVQRSGGTTGVRGGKIAALGVTVNYAEGTVTGLIKTSVCAEAGDSGGPLFDDGRALGITSGASGTCSNGGISFYQPVREALNRYGVSVY